MRAALRRLGVVVLGLALVCCAHPTTVPPSTAVPPPSSQGPPPFLVPTAEIPGEFLWRQVISARYPQGSARFEAVVQKHCGELVVVGFAPFGAQAFSLRQHGVEVEREVSLGPLPFAPDAVLYDVHRVFFGSFGPPLAEGERTVERDGEQIRETWSQSKLRTRSYRRLDGVPAGAVSIDYGAGLGPDGPPPRVELRSEWFGYVLEIMTIDREETPCSDRPTR